MTPLPVRTTDAAILASSNSPLVVDEIRLPKSLRYGQVLVQVHWSGVCASQVGEIAAVKGPDRHLPHLLGHEGSATVLAVGEGVTHVAVGDDVVLHWRPGAGLQGPPAEYEWRAGTLNAGYVTTFNRHAVVSENRMTRVPGGLDPRLTPLLGCAVTTGFGAVANDAQITIGKSLVVFGAGGVGLAAIMAGRLSSAFPIVGVDVNEEKLAVARRLGATHAVLAPSVDDVAAAIRGIVGQGGADAVIDTTGNPSVSATAYAVTAGDGRTVLVGVPPVGVTTHIETLPLHFGRILTGSHGGASRPAIDIPRYVRLIEARRMDLAQFPTTAFSLGEINDALESLRRGEGGRPLVRMSG